MCTVVTAGEKLPNMQDIVPTNVPKTPTFLTAEEKSNLDVDGLVRKLEELEQKLVTQEKKHDAEKNLLLNYIAQKTGKGDEELSDINKMLLGRKDPLLESLMRNPNGKYMIDPQSGALVLMKAQWRYTVTPGGSVVMDCFYNDGVYIPQTIYVGADKARKLIKGDDPGPAQQPPGSTFNFGR